MSLSNLVKNELIKITTNIDTDYAIVNLNLPYEYCGYAFNTSEFEVVDDIFSTENYLKVCTESFNTLICGGHVNAECKVSGNVESEDRVVDEVLGTCCNTITVATTFVENNNLVLEGVASTTVLYFNKESNNTYSMVVEMPFSMTVFSIRIFLGVNPSWIKLSSKLSLMASSDPSIRVRCMSFERLSTNVPLPLIRMTHPFNSILSRLLRAVVLLTPYCCMSSCSDGTRSPGASSPFMIRSMIS